MKKRLITPAVLFVLILLLTVNATISVSAASNPYPEQHTLMGYPLVNCTWYAWQQVYDNTGVAFPNFGNAINWYTGARNHGYATGTVAKANSVAVWRTANGYGHVGWVVSVSGSKMRVNEGGMTDGTGPANGTGIVIGESYNSTVGEAKFNGSSTILVGFIYPTEGVTSNVEVLATQEGSTDVIKDTNATLFGTVNKTSAAIVNKLGLRITKQGTDYASGKTYQYTPSSNYSGHSVVHPWFDINDELNYTLTHATTYKYQFYAQVDGKDYWSVEKTFTTTGSHSYGNWETVTQPGCTTTGEQKRTCSCGTVEKKAISAAGHNYASDFTVDQNPTCTTAGSKSRHCPKCSATTEAIVIPAKGHSYSTEWKVEKQATCTSSGFKIHLCTSCGAKSSATTIPATGHSFGNWTVEQEASTTADGKKVRVCNHAGCTARVVISIPKLATDGHTHSYGQWQAETKATCIWGGIDVRVCTGCGAKQSEISKATGHQFGQWEITKAADCISGGERTSTCSVCNEKKTESIEPLGHEFGDWTTATNVSETAMIRTCGRCGITEHSDAQEETQGTNPTETEQAQQTTVMETQQTDAPALEEPSQEEPSQNSDTVWIAIVISAVFVLLGCVSAVYFFVKAKKLRNA